MMVLGALPIGIDVGGFKCIRIVRVVRPLQKRNETVKNLMAALIASFSSIFHVINLLILLIFIFALMGVNLFRGRFFLCNDESILEGYEGCVGTNFGGLPNVPCIYRGEESDPAFPFMCEQDLGTFNAQQILVPRVWMKRKENFETIHTAALLLLRLSSQDDLRPIYHRYITML